MEEEEDEEDGVQVVIDTPVDTTETTEGTVSRTPGALKYVRSGVTEEQHTTTITPSTTTQNRGQMVPKFLHQIPGGINEMIPDDNIYTYDFDSEERPWRKPGADITDYFNYGFTEESWRIYCVRQQQIRNLRTTERILPSHEVPRDDHDRVRRKRIRDQDEAVIELG